MRLHRPVRSLVREPQVEVVVPCYNYGRFLPGCVESILGQSGVRTTVTIVDDASDDGSAEIADRLACRHRAVRVIHNDVNLGAVPTFNRGIAQADSDYLLLLSADDLVAPGALARAAAVMEAHPSVGLVYGHARKFTTTPPRSAPRAWPAETWTTWSGRDWIGLQLRRTWNNISSPEAMVRTSVQHAAGAYDPGLPHTHDVEMWLRIAALADVAHVNGVDQAYYRRHQVSLSSRLGPYHEVWERWRAYDQFLAGWAGVPDREALRARVGRRLAEEVLGDLLVDLEFGTADHTLIATALDLARRLSPAVVDGARWSDVQAQVADDGPGGAAGRARAGARALAHRARWRRWRRFRYLG